MTLIAGFKINKTPILIGDLKIGFKSSPNAFSFKKKVAIIADNAALAWCGDEIASHVVYQQIYDRFPRIGLLNKLDLYNFLRTNLCDCENSALHANFIGWIVEEGSATCFQWATYYVSEISEAEPAVDGTGESLARPYLVHPDTISKWRDGCGIEHDLYCLSGFLSYLMQQETSLYRDPLRTFGLGYEAIYFDGERFNYFEDILYVSVEVRLDRQGKLLTQSISLPMFKYEHKHDYGLLYINSGSCPGQVLCLLPPGLEKEREQEIKSECHHRIKPSPIDIWNARYCTVFFKFFREDKFIRDAIVFKDSMELRTGNPVTVGIDISNGHTYVEVSLPDKLIERILLG